MIVSWKWVSFFTILTSSFVQMGQLGFHVQHDGLITEVENFGYAWQTGLRQGSRLVEVDVNTFIYLLPNYDIDMKLYQQINFWDNN